MTAMAMKTSFEKWICTASNFTALIPSCLRWLNTVLRVVSSNLSDGACFKLEKQTWQRKKQSYTEDNNFSKSTLLKLCDIQRNFYFYRTFNSKNFKMEVKKTNFVTHLIITVQSYYWLSKNLSLKIWSYKFQMVMINYIVSCVQVYRKI